MSRSREFLPSCNRIRLRRSRRVLIAALISLALAPAMSLVEAAQLELNWVDNSGGQASFVIQRAINAGAAPSQFTPVAQVPIGMTSYTDTTVSLGTTYCYQVAAVQGNVLSSYSTTACAVPGGGFSVKVTNAAVGGTVASSPPGIDCGATCSFTYPAGKLVTLTAVPSPGWTFSGWSRGGCSGTGPCTIVGNGSVIVHATFAAAPGQIQTLPAGTPQPGTDTPMSLPGSVGKGGKK